jgi:hypothetical protein
MIEKDEKEESLRRLTCAKLWNRITKLIGTEDVEVQWDQEKGKYVIWIKYGFFRRSDVDRISAFFNIEEWYVEEKDWIIWEVLVGTPKEGKI